MKPTFLIIAALVLGVGVGIGMTVSQLTSAPPSAVPGEPGNKVLAPVSNPGAPTFDPDAKLEIDHTTFNFGAMEKGEKRSHVFTFRSVGAKPVVLVRGETTCKCTLSSFGDNDQTRAEIAPGESLDVTLTWEAKDDANPSFRQTAVIFSNDQAKDRLVLAIEGNIEASLTALPSTLLLGELTPGESKTVESFLVTKRTDDLAVKEHSFAVPETAPFFDVSIEPASATERGSLSARSALRVRLTVKPGLPAGTIQQALLLNTNLDGVPPATITVNGSVQGNMKVSGRGYVPHRTNSGIIDLGFIPKGQGAERKLRVLLRGPDRDKIQLQVGSKRPESLQVTFGEPRPLNDAVTEVPVTIALPKDTPPMQYLGREGSGETAMTSEEKSALVVIETGHPEYGEHRVMIRLTVGQ